MTVPERGINVLVQGDTLSGKSWLAGALVERLAGRQYSVCVIDPEGDYRVLAALPGVSWAEVKDEIRWRQALERMDHDPSACVVLDLSTLDHAERSALVGAGLALIRERRRCWGPPHWVVLDEAHYWLRHDGVDDEAIGLDDKGFCLVTYRASSLRESVWNAIDVFLFGRTTSATELHCLRKVFQDSLIQDVVSILPSVPYGEFLSIETDDERKALTFVAAPRTTWHVRHLRKYAEGRLPPTAASSCDGPTVGWSRPSEVSASFSSRWRALTTTCSPSMPSGATSRAGSSRSSPIVSSGRSSRRSSGGGAGARSQTYEPRSGDRSPTPSSGRTSRGRGNAVGGETLAGMFWSRVETSGDVPAQMMKSGGRWRQLTWSEVGAVVRELALGLLALGRRPGEAVALLSRSRAEWVQADFAILSAGCVTVPIYPSYTPGQIAWIVNDAEARTLMVEDGAQLAKALEVRGAMPGLDTIVVIESAEGHVPPILTFAELRARGRQSAETVTRSLVERVAAIAPESVATIVYTSGTTGEPKGVVQTHGNHVASLRALAQIRGVEPGDVHLLFLPLAHAFARLEAFIGVHRGLVTAFAESLERVAENLREVRPHFIFAVPRVFEKVHARILGDVGATSALKRRVFRWAMGVGARASRLEQAKQPLPRGLTLQREMAHRLVFAKLRDALGGRLRFAVSGGAPLPREIAEFFHAAGILIVEGYGLTETCPALTFNRIDAFRFGSVGQRLPGVELRLAADGEILARGPNVATRGYWKQPAATAEAFDTEGWFHTGDIGRIDEEGFVYITDRKKDLIVTSGGINVAPQHVENLLKTDPFISQAMVYGDRRPYPIALVTLDAGEIVRFAREHGILVGDPAALARHPAVVERVARIVDATNAQLPSYARVKKFAVLPGELTEDTGELTPTQKVKRRMVAAKYQETIDALYRE